MINNLLQTRHEMHVVEDELLSIWATVHSYSERDTLMLVYSDFLNEVLQGQTHLHFYCQCNRIITQMINGDDKEPKSENGKHRRTQQKTLPHNLNRFNAGHIRIERLIEVVQKVFTPSTLL